MSDKSDKPDVVELDSRHEIVERIHKKDLKPMYDTNHEHVYAIDQTDTTDAYYAEVCVVRNCNAGRLVAKDWQVLYKFIKIRNFMFRKYKHFFAENREVAIKRDGEQCVNCGMSRVEHLNRYGRDITVDHIDRNGRNKPRKLQNNSLNNLQTLCLSCHGKKDVRSYIYGNGGLRKITVEDIKMIRKLLGGGQTGKSIAERFNVSQMTISDIKNRKLDIYNNV